MKLSRHVWSPHSSTPKRSYGGYQGRRGISQVALAPVQDRIAAIKDDVGCMPQNVLIKLPFMHMCISLYGSSSLSRRVFGGSRDGSAGVCCIPEGSIGVLASRSQRFGFFGILGGVFFPPITSAVSKGICKGCQRNISILAPCLCRFALRSNSACDRAVVQIRISDRAHSSRCVHEMDACDA